MTRRNSGGGRSRPTTRKGRAEAQMKHARAMLESTRNALARERADHRETRAQLATERGDHRETRAQLATERGDHRETRAQLASSEDRVTDLEDVAGRYKYVIGVG